MTTTSMEHQARRAANSQWADRLARLGFCARGLVYVIVGILALQIAWGSGGNSDASKQGALREIAARPFGTALLAVLAVGLAGYAVWRLSEALWGKQDEEDERKRTAKRLGSAAKAALYGAFCVTTVRLLMSGQAESGKGNEQERTLTARALELSGGRFLVGAVGVALIVGGGYVAFRGVTQKFDKRLDTWDMGSAEQPIIVLGTIGLAARGLLFAAAGFLVVKAAVDFDPQEAQGLDGTLRVIARQAFGQVLLTVLALGLIAYGLFSFAEARYRRL